MGIRKPYLYEVGEIVNDTLRIVEQIRMKKGKYTQKGYIVQSTVYLNSTPYEVRESHLKEGVGCAYASGQRICEGNSLWDKEHIRPYIIDIEQSKIIGAQSGKKINFKCSNDNCGNIKKMVVQNLVNQGFACQNCSTGLPYPERMFTAYLTIKNIPFETQVKFDNTQRKIDYRIRLNNTIVLVETHGAQHYYKEDSGFYKVKSIQESDGIKRKYAEDNNINYIELDCSNSDFNFIKHSINENEYLPNIEKSDEESIIKLIEMSSKYDVNEIIKLYTKDKLSTIKIAKIYNVNYSTIGDILKRNNIKLREPGAPKRAVKCVELNKVFDSSIIAMRETGAQKSNIIACCNGRKKSAGGYHWEYAFEE